MPQRTLHAKLVASSTITDIVSTRVRPGWLTDQDTLPALTYVLIDDSRVNASKGGTETRRCLIQLNCWGSTYAEAQSIDLALSDLLDGTNGTDGWTDKTSDPAISSCLYDGGGDIEQPVQPGQDKPIAYGRRRDYVIWYYDQPS